MNTYGLSVALLGVARPHSSASRSFASIASALRFLKSSSWTSPTVCADRMSSAVFAWVVKRELGVDVPELASDAIIESKMVDKVEMVDSLRDKAVTIIRKER